MPWERPGSTPRNESLYPPRRGTAYVYFHLRACTFCLNAVTGDAGRGEAPVLLRAGAAVEGEERMAEKPRLAEEGSVREILAGGPGKLCRAPPGDRAAKLDGVPARPARRSTSRRESLLGAQRIVASSPHRASTTRERARGRGRCGFSVAGGEECVPALAGVEKPPTASAACPRNGVPEGFLRRQQGRM